MDWKTKAPTLLAGALAVTSPPALAQEAVPERVDFQPATPWNIDYADESCALVRRFTDGERQIWFELRGIAPVDTVRLTVGTDRLGVTDEDPHITVFPGREPMTKSAAHLEGEGDIADAFVMTASLNSFRTSPHLSPADYASARSEVTEPSVENPPIAGIQIAGAFEDIVVLRTGEMEAALQALDVCMTHLVETWGIDPELLTQVATLPEARDRQHWERRVRQHYPRSGARRSRNTSFPIVVLVDPEGRVARCNSPSAMGDEDFLQVACAAMTEYARFEPARAEDGRAVYGFWWTSMVYITY